MRFHGVFFLTNTWLFYKIVERAQAASTEKSSGSSTLEEFEEFVTGGTKKIAKGHVNGTSLKKEGKKTVEKKPEAANFIDIEGSLNGDSVQMFPEEAFDLDSFFPAYIKKSVPVTEDTSLVRLTTLKEIGTHAVFLFLGYCSV